MREHEKRSRAAIDKAFKTRAEGIVKEKKDKKKDDEKKTPKKPPTPASVEALILEIKHAEIAAVRDGKYGQIYYNKKTGKIWTEHFTPSDRYLPAENAKNIMQIWETEPKTLSTAIGRNAGEEGSDVYNATFKSYIAGNFSSRFDPGRIAEKIEEHKLGRPGLGNPSKPAAESPAAESPAATSAESGAKTLREICAQEYLAAAGLSHDEKTTEDRLWDCLIQFVKFVELQLQDDAAARVILEKYAEKTDGLGGKIWEDVPRYKLFDALRDILAAYYEPVKKSPAEDAETGE